MQLPLKELQPLLNLDRSDHALKLPILPTAKTRSDNPCSDGRAKRPDRQMKPQPTTTTRSRLRPFESSGCHSGLRKAIVNAEPEWPARTGYGLAAR